MIVKHPPCLHSTIPQVLKYQPSQQYRAHMDVLLYPTPEDGQSRCATVLMYLTGKRQDTADDW